MTNPKKVTHTVGGKAPTRAAQKTLQVDEAPSLTVRPASAVQDLVQAALILCSHSGIGGWTDRGTAGDCGEVPKRYVDLLHQRVRELVEVCPQANPNP